MGNDFDTSILTDIGHRPWAMPDRPWMMTQSWHDLLFAHWRVDASVLRPLIPSVFELDLLDGQAWIGVVPFRMSNVGLRGAPIVPWLSAFPELNVRTYVRIGDRPGVWFFSLDATRMLAVATARLTLNLPYYVASIRATASSNGAGPTIGAGPAIRVGPTIEYESRRWHGAATAEFSGSYAPIGPVFAARPGTVEHFLAERYCLYEVNRRGFPYRLEIHHRAWPLQEAQATFHRNTMAAAGGVTLPDQPPLLHFARRLDVVAWSPERVSA